jgi:hypothetical protein
MAARHNFKATGSGDRQTSRSRLPHNSGQLVTRTWRSPAARRRRRPTACAGGITINATARQRAAAVVHTLDLRGGKRFRFGGDRSSSASISIT